MPNGQRKTIREIARDLHEVGAIDDAQLQEYEQALDAGRGTRATDSHAERVALLTKAATSALGSRERAIRWMRRRNRALGGDTPEGWLDSEEGLTRVLAILERINGGVIG
jgi:uncharacterized protein (DUF2384 family)